MYYFDCCCEIGPRNGKDPAAPWNVEDALRWMDHCGIAGALVCHTMSRQCDPILARQRLANEIGRAPERLFPVWDFLPPDAGDFECDPYEFYNAMCVANVRAVRLLPRSHAFPFCAKILASHLEVLEQKGIPVLIDYAELPDGYTPAYTVMDEFLRSFPRLFVILRQTYWSCQRIITALMERYSNLYIEFSNYQANRVIETYVSRYGAERLLFGTGLTAKSAGAARAYIDYAQVSPAARSLIAGENLARLLGGICPSPAPKVAKDSLRKAAASGQPLPHTLVLDAHSHILPEGHNGAGSYVMYSGDAQGLIEMKDLLGISQTAIMSWAGPIASDLESNEVVSKACSCYADRFIGVAYINPTHMTKNALINELRLRVEKQGFLGLKPYPYVGLPYNDPLYNPCWEYANRLGLYALVHMENAGTISKIAGDLATRFPRIQWIIAHTGSSFEMARAVTAIMKQFTNIWAELTFTSVTNGVIEWMVSEVGDNRILFGTDAPMRDPRPQFGWVVWSNISIASRRRILGGNFSRLLSIVKSGGVSAGKVNNPHRKNL